MISGFNRRALRVLHRLQGFLAWLFAVQLQVIVHPCRRKAVLTPRRAGKTEMACVWLLDAASKNPGRKFLYIALSRKNAKDIAWLIFKKLNLEFNLNCHFHESNVEITLPNGAMIMLRGADQENWIERLEGQEFLLIVIDESGLYNISVRKLVYDSLSPMVDSCGGTICMIGRPGVVKAGLFWDVTNPELRQDPKTASGAWMVTDKKGGKEWAVFNWSTFDNPFVAQRWREEIAAKLRINPDLANDPGFRRNYFGEWADDAEGLVYAFSEARNVIDDWKPEPGDQFGMATDFGWDDAQGFLVGCWNPNRPTLIICESYKQANMPLSDALARIESYQHRYPDMHIWGDPAKKQLYMEMANRFGAIVNPAQKEEKHDNIKLMNSDYALGLIQVVRATNRQFIDEIRSLTKLIGQMIEDAALGKARPGEWKEHPRKANDLCDCSLYVWRHSRHFRYQAQHPGPPPGSPEAMDAMIMQTWEREAEEAARRQKQAWWKR